MSAENPLFAEGFQLLETLLLEAGALFIGDAHLARMAASAAACGFTFPEAELRRQLENCVMAHPRGSHRLRLLLSRDGRVELQVFPFEHDPKPRRLGLARQPLARGNPFLQHKTTRRAIYAEQQAAWPGCDDVLLHNADGLLTESCIANLVLLIDGAWLTPAASAGLLPGTFRAELLARGEIREADLPLPALDRADQIWLVNSLRRWVPVERLLR